MEGFPFFLGVIGNVTSMLVFLSPINTFRRIVKHKSTEEFECLPYICALLSTSLWTYYGIVKPGAFLVATVNAFGISVEIIYVGLFLFFAPPKMKVKIALFVGTLNVGFLVAAVLVTRLALQGEARIGSTGFLCAALNVIMYASPLASMDCGDHQECRVPAFLLSLFLFLSGGVWVPNGTGFILGTSQLLLYSIYRDPKPRFKSSISIDPTPCGLEEGSQHQPLVLSCAKA